MHKPIAEKEAPEPEPKSSCNCGCGEATAEKACPKYNPIIEVAKNEQTNYPG